MLSKEPLQFEKIFLKNQTHVYIFKFVFILPELFSKTFYFMWTNIKAALMYVYHTPVYSPQRSEESTRFLGTGVRYVRYGR